MHSVGPVITVLSAHCCQRKSNSSSHVSDIPHPGPITVRSKEIVNVVWGSFEHLPQFARLSNRISRVPGYDAVRVKRIVDYENVNVFTVPFLTEHPVIRKIQILVYRFRYRKISCSSHVTGRIGAIVPGDWLFEI